MVPTDELEGYARRPRVLTWMLIALGTGVLGAAIYLAFQPADEREAPPHFELPLLSGGTLSSERLEGSPVVLNFFASWCAPCREEAPLLERSWRAYRDRGVRFVGVAINDARADTRRFVDEFGITYPVVRDESDRLARALDVAGLPQTFFIDESWHLLRVSAGETVGERTRTIVPLGAISAEELERNVQLLLEES
jgi:cytochrome c biogenesis protein CcmG, thiol:disulfide interchange protein DsbE